MSSQLGQSDRRLILTAFGVATNLVILGIILLSAASRPIPEVLSYLALSLASQLSGAMIALGLGIRPGMEPEPSAVRRK